MKRKINFADVICVTVISASIILIAYEIGLILIGGWRGWSSIWTLSLNLWNIFIFWYIRRDGAEKPGSDEYSKTIAKVARIVSDLKNLGEFLESEQKKISEAELAVRHLQQEKSSLEPVVTASRETVAAILAAHSAQTARAAWKERLIGVALGISTSVIASALYDYFKK